MDKQKYEWGRKYTQLILLEWRAKSVSALMELVDGYKIIAYKSGDSASLGIADQLWQWVLEKEYEAAS